jgi:predicted MFS family arabinose efflux permease
VDIAILIVFGVILAIAVASLLVFRRRRLSTRLRVILSLVAVVLLANWQIRENPSLLGAVAFIVFAVFVLGAGIYYLWQADKEPRE